MHRSAADFLVALNAAFAGKQRVQNLVIPSLLPTAIGAPWGPGFSEIELEKNTNFLETAKNSRRKGGGYSYYALVAMPTACPLVGQDL